MERMGMGQERHATCSGGAIWQGVACVAGRATAYGKGWTDDGRQGCMGEGPVHEVCMDHGRAETWTIVQE